MSRLPEFTRHLVMMEEIHQKKNEDYASAHDPLENFHRSTAVVEWFNGTRDYPYVILITIKLARLATLLNGHTPPNNESIADSFLDLTTYCNLWWCDYERRTKEAGDSIRIKDGDSSVSHQPTGGYHEVNQRQDAGNTKSTDADRLAFARRVVENMTGIFIPGRTDAVEPMVHRMVGILKEYESEIIQNIFPRNVLR